MTKSQLLKKVGLASLSITATILTLEISNSAQAATMSFTGTFSADDSLASFDLTLTNSLTNITAQTFSYGGGTQADGNVVLPGGFDPILTLFDSNGNFLADSDDGMGNIDPNTGEAFDAFLQFDGLTPGDYTVVVSQFDNFFESFFGSPSFTYQGEPTFTNEGFFPGCSNGQFCDDTGDNRTNEFALDITTTTNTQVVPEPLTILGSITALGAGAIFKKKRNCN